MTNIESVLALVRPEILALAPYSSARKESKGGRVWLEPNGYGGSRFIVALPAAAG